MPKKTFSRLPEAKRKRIENAALNAFNDKGYDRTTIRDIVRKAEIPRGSFYQYFDGMEDVFEHLLTVVSMKKMDFMKPVWDKLEHASFIGLYPEFIHEGIKFAYSDREAYLFGYHLFNSNSATIKRLHKTLEAKGIAMMESLLEIDKRKGIIKEDVNLNLLARLLYDFNARQLVMMVYDHDSDDVDTIMELANEFLSIINYGIIPEEEDHENESV
ncbi:MAG: TetR/AcrR family transcriptional regulator [Bacillota bacterium]